MPESKDFDPSPFCGGVEGAEELTTARFGERDIPWLSISRSVNGFVLPFTSGNVGKSLSFC